MTLQRRGEIAGMRKDEVDLEQATWLIPGGGRSKRDKSHLVPLSPLAVSLIREAIALQPRFADEPDSPFVFPSLRTPLEALRAPSLTHAACELYPVLGLEDVTVHDLRRTGATMMASERLGVMPFVISQVLGHSSDTGGAAGVTMRSYNVYLYAAEKRAALNAWSSLLLRITGAATAGFGVAPEVEQPAAQPVAPERRTSEIHLQLKTTCAPIFQVG